MIRLISIAALLSLSLGALAQNTYNMFNGVVSDCDGIFLDSDAGMPSGNYDHNEDLTFTIAIPQATEIRMIFTQFCSEFGIDTLRFFDGPDVNSPLIFGPHSGTTNPPVIIANSGYLTIHFKSDANLACGGWEAAWSTTVRPPIPPSIDSIQASCSSNQVLVYLDTTVHCDSIYPSAFSLSGVNPPSVTGASPLNCSNDSTRVIQLDLSNSFGDCGNFLLDYDLSIADVCDSVYDFQIPGTFGIDDCPLSVNIVAASDSICEGGCTTVMAFGQGGDCNLTYTWSNGLPSTRGPHSICLNGDTSFYVVLSDTKGNPNDTAHISIFEIPYPEAGPDTVWCTNNGLLNLTHGAPSNGTWTGVGIIDPIGSFDPSIPGPGDHYVYYSVNGCSDSMQISVFNLNPGPNRASCPGEPPFQLGGTSPPGGYFIGPFTDSSGMFNPAVPGVYQIAYHLGNCHDSITVSVDTISYPGPDSTCINNPAFFLNMSPAGGLYTGPGTQPSTGLFNPVQAGIGTHQIYYDVVGCRDTFEIEVVDIDVGSLEVYCPNSGLITMRAPIPAGGYWEGNGVVDSINGVYDPSWAGGNANDTVVYYAFGCSDTTLIYIRETVVAMDTLHFCIDDNPILLNTANTGRHPGNGTWTGPGVTSPQFPGEFDPQIAGVGTFQLDYDANGCMDSMVVVIHPQPSLSPQPALCEYDNPVNLQASPQGGIWAGLGITDAQNGTFDPFQAGPGNHWVTYENQANCIDSIQIQVDAFPILDASSVQLNHCYSSQGRSLNFSPSGGTLSGPGVSNNVFYPASAGTGTHTLQYLVTNGTCVDSMDVQVNVGSPLQAFAQTNTDTICPRDSSLLSVSGFSGNGGPYFYSWSHGLGTNDSVWVNPSITTTYTITVSDNCSDPIQVNLRQEVHPEISSQGNPGPTICYADSGYATISGGSNYQYTWNTNPVQTGDTVFGRPGTYSVYIQDTQTGCEGFDTVEIISHPYINAAFTKFPNRPCINTAEGEIQMFDFSTGGVTGYWYFGEGDSIPYTPGSSPIHEFSDTGTYALELVIYNQAGCESVFRDTICIEPEPVLHVPTAFSPNGDGINDRYTFFLAGVYDVQWRIFNRWGEQVYFQTGDELSWEGNDLKGNMVPMGPYPSILIYRDMLTGRKKKLVFSIFVIR